MELLRLAECLMVMAHMEEEMPDIVDRLRLEVSERNKEPDSFSEEFTQALQDASDEIEFYRKAFSELPRYSCSPGVSVASFNPSPSGNWVKWDDVKYIQYGPNLVLYG